MMIVFMVLGVFSFVLVPGYHCQAPVCDIQNENERFDCHPDVGPTAINCAARGCCWKSTLNDPQNNNNKLIYEPHVKRPISAPFCFFPKNYPTYNVTSWKETDYGYTGTLFRSAASCWPNDVKTLALDIWFETEQRLHVKIYDPSTKRYEVPIETPPPPKTKVAHPEYGVRYNASPFSITIFRQSNGAILFDSSIMTAPLIFADQFIQISSRLSTELLYGLGGRKAHLLHNASSWQQMVMWARDAGPSFGSNLYGSHPFYLNIEKDGKAHGVFLLNSNAMDIDVQPFPSVTFRTIGGILDFYIFTGPRSSEVIDQYTAVIGRPQMPPYWALGFHLCRYNYNSVEKLKLVIARNRKIKIPYDVQWTDIDYMNSHLDWTYDEKAYHGLPDVVKDLHDYTQKYVIIVDPGISSTNAGKYRPYDEGLAANVFVLNATGSPLVGAVWPGPTVFPDFSHPNSTAWWYNQSNAFHKILPFDGLWTDMNEPSNFVIGSSNGCTKNNLDHPPYVPGITGDGQLAFATVCPSAKHYLSSHYNMHNLYGMLEANATNSALHMILGKRSIVISRSSYPSLGKYGGHWSGDISSTWEDLYYSIPAILEYQFYGIPLVGADICGFAGNTTEELCIRWMQLGAFYPFMRNHNDASNADQDPGAFSIRAQNIMKSVLQLRYALLPFFYTRFYYSHLTGSPVIYPLFFHYPMDMNTYEIDRQFMWGSELLISPILDQGHTDVEAYFPADIWYDIYDGQSIMSKGKSVLLKAALEKINVHVRGGSIIPLQEPAITTTLARQNPFGLLVAFNASGKATGSLFWDDGESLDSITSELYSYIIFEAQQGSVVSNVIQNGYKPSFGMDLTSASIYGVPKAPSSAIVNDHVAAIHYHPDTQELRIDSFRVDLLMPIFIKWQ